MELVNAILDGVEVLVNILILIYVFKTVVHKEDALMVPAIVIMDFKEAIVKINHVLINVLYMDNALMELVHVTYIGRD